MGLTEDFAKVNGSLWDRVFDWIEGTKIGQRLIAFGEEGDRKLFEKMGRGVSRLKNVFGITSTKSGDEQNAAAQRLRAGVLEREHLKALADNNPGRMKDINYGVEDPSLHHPPGITWDFPSDRDILACNAYDFLEENKLTPEQYIGMSKMSDMEKARYKDRSYNTVMMMLTGHLRSREFSRRCARERFEKKQLEQVRLQQAEFKKNKKIAKIETRRVKKKSGQALTV